MRAGIAKILRHQNDDGGFGLWIGAGPELHYTAYALWGLEIARRGGYPAKPGAPEDGVRYLKARLQAEATVGRRRRWRCAGETGTRAFVHHVLAELGQGDAGALGALFERRRELPVYGRAFLLRALVETERNDQARTLAGELLALIPGSTGPAIVKEGAAARLVLELGRAHHGPGVAGAAGGRSPGPRGHRPVGPGPAGRAQRGALVQHAGERVRPDRAGRAGPGAGGRARRCG